MAVPSRLMEAEYKIQFGTEQLGHVLPTKLLMSTILTTAQHFPGERQQDHQLLPLEACNILY